LKIILGFVSKNVKYLKRKIAELIEMEVYWYDYK